MHDLSFEVTVKTVPLVPPAAVVAEQFLACRHHDGVGQALASSLKLMMQAWECEVICEDGTKRGGMYERVLMVLAVRARATIPYKGNCQ